MKMQRHAAWPLWIFLPALAAGVFLLGRPPAAPAASPGGALDLTTNEDVVPAVRNKDGKLVIFNFRAVEPGVLYRSSGFPRNSKVVVNGRTKKRAAAFGDKQAFDFLKERNIRTIVTFEETEYNYGEKGYFDYWKKRDGYEIKVVALPVNIRQAYDKGPDGAVRAAGKFLELMKAHKPQDGAVLVHCSVGKDRTGIAIAAYELWRNRGKMNRDELWTQVRNRYLASNAVLKQDREASSWAGREQQCLNCGDDKSGPGFVCGEWLDKLRPDLESLARL